MRHQLAGWFPFCWDLKSCRVLENNLNKPYNVQSKAYHLWPGLVIMYALVLQIQIHLIWTRIRILNFAQFGSGPNSRFVRFNFEFKIVQRKKVFSTFFKLTDAFILEYVFLISCFFKYKTGILYFFSLVQCLNCEFCLQSYTFCLYNLFKFYLFGSGFGSAYRNTDPQQHY